MSLLTQSLAYKPFTHASFVQQAIGYSLTGSTSEQCLFIMIGDGANGKSTFIT